MATWDWSYNGVAFGGSTGIDVPEVEGWLDLPDIRSYDMPRARQHGLYAGQDLAGGRAVRFRCEVRAADEDAAAALLAPLIDATVVQPTELLLVGTTPGRPAVRLSCRPRRRSPSLRWDSTIGATDVDIEFFATDPHLYADTASTATTGLATGSGGFIVPAVVPWTSSGGSGSTMSCQNDGNFPAPWVATFTGPLVTPTLTHVGTGKQLLLTGVGASIAAGETLIVDSLNHTVLLNGTASRYSWLASASRWFELAPGANAVNLTGASGSGTVQIDWRSTWL